LTDLLSF